MSGLLQAGTYNAAAIQLNVNGVRITGIAEEGITVEALEARGEVTIGLDGSLTYSLNPVTARRITVNLDPTKRGYKDLSELAKAWEDTIRGGAPMPSHPIVLKDPINGTEYVAARTLYTNRPGAQFQKTAGSVAFELVADQPQERHAPSL